MKISKINPIIPIILLYALSFADAMFTVLAISSGKFYEANPLMKYLLDISPPFFVFVKMFITWLACVLLYMNWESKAVKWVTALMLVLYTALNINHIVLFIVHGY